MSQALFNARRGLTQVPGLLKQGKFLIAVQHIQVGLKLLISSSMMRSEQEEFRQLLKDACMHLDGNIDLRKLFPLAIEFVEDKEAELQETLSELVSILETEATKDLASALEMISHKKQTALEKGQHELDSGAHDDARKTFSDLTVEFADDADLAADVGDRFLRSGLFEDASHYLEESSRLNPASAHVFNRLGIALRKMKRFDVAEENFLKALAIEKLDPNLYFNLGRLYLDWKKWKKTIENADAALKLDANFTEAKQLANYARRMMSQG